MITHNAGLNGDSLAWYKIFDTLTDSSDDSSGFVAKDEGCLQRKVAVSAMQIIVHCAGQLKSTKGEMRSQLTITTTEARGHDGHLTMVVWQWP